MTASRPTTTHRFLGERLARVRAELFGENGGPYLALFLHVPARDWARYEAGHAIPTEVLERFVELTNVNTRWLASGRGPVYRDDEPA